MGLTISKAPKKTIDCTHPPRKDNIPCVDVQAWESVVCPVPTPNPKPPTDEFEKRESKPNAP